MEVRRAKETELLWVGDQYRQALKRYFAATPGETKQYPRSLAALLEDKRGPVVVRHLRRLYRDPVTGGMEWGLLLDKDGGIVGVFSLSRDAPIKIDGFAKADAAFKGALRYADWRFLADDKVAVASMIGSEGQSLAESGLEGEPSQAPAGDGDSSEDAPDTQPATTQPSPIIPTLPLPRLPPNPTPEQARQFACDLQRRNAMIACYQPLNALGEEAARDCVAAIEATYQACVAGI